MHDVSRSEATALDVAVYIALAEEMELLFDPLVEALGVRPSWEESPDIAVSWCTAQIPNPRDDRAIRVAFIPAGRMGITRAGNIVSALAQTLRPRNFVVLGIAGSLSGDLQPGDVFIPHSVHEYLANSAAIGDQKIEFQTSGNHYNTDARLLSRFQTFRLRQQAQFATWQQETQTRAEALFDPDLRSTLEKAGLVDRWSARLLAGDDRHLASGPAVGKGLAFTRWLRHRVDRKAAALEMETAGVYDVAETRTEKPGVIAIRGISDFADERKEQLESVAKSAFRKLAVFNALSLLLAGIRAGFFAKGPLSEESDASSVLAEDSGSEAPPPQSLPGPGGPFNPKFYIPWASETKSVERTLRRRQPAVVFGPAQFGKTWFLKALVAHLSSRYRIVSLGTRRIPSNAPDPDRFLRWIGDLAVRSCGGDPSWVDEAWASSEWDTERFRNLLERWLLPADPRPVLFAIDDAEKLFDRDSSIRLFTLFRDFYEESSEPWDRFLVLATVNRTLTQLKQSHGNESFFVIARILPLYGFQNRQIQSLARCYGVSCEASEVAAVVESLGGHPKLVHQLFYEVVRRGSSVFEELGRSKVLFREHMDRCRQALDAPALGELAKLRTGQPSGIDEAIADMLYGLGLVLPESGGWRLRGSIYQSLRAHP